MTTTTHGWLAQYDLGWGYRPADEHGNARDEWEVGTPSPDRYVALRAIVRQYDLPATARLAAEDGPLGTYDQAASLWAIVSDDAQVVPFASDSTYRVKGGAWLAEPRACDLDGNGFRVTADGAEALLSGAALEYLSESRSENDDGYVEDGLIWAAGDAHEIVPA